MTVGERLEQLIAGDQSDYFQLRLQIGDQFIEMVKTMMPRDWKLIEEKEEEYQRVIGLISELKFIDDDKSGYYGC